MIISDFRIGNFIAGQDGTYRVHIITEIKERAIISRPPNVYDFVSSAPVSKTGDSSVLPIPLTINWLKRLGFNAGKLEVTPFIYFSYRDGLFFIHVNTCYMALHHIKYVHQIQNLYHSLTGQELHVNEAVL